MSTDALSSEEQTAEQLAAEQDAGTGTEKSDATSEGGEKESQGTGGQEAKEEFVPLQKHQNLQNAVAQSRHIQRELREENRTLSDKITKMENTFQTLMERGPAKQEPITSFDDDPIKHMEEQNAILKQRLSDMEKAQASGGEQQQTQPDLTPEQQQLIDEVKQYTQQFTESNPDYPQAYEFWFKARVAELRDLGYSQDDMQATVSQELAKIAQSNIDRGENPAQQIYTLAQQKGYKPSAESGGKQQQDGKNSGSQGKDLDELAKEQELNKSLGAGGGGNPSLEELSDMGEDELDVALKEMGYTK